MSTCIDVYDHDYLLKCIKDKWLSKWNEGCNETFKAVQFANDGNKFFYILNQDQLLIPLHIRDTHWYFMSYNVYLL